MGRLFIAAFLSVVIAGCAGAPKRFGHYKLRRRDGVCQKDYMSNGVKLEVCLTNGLPKTAYDNPEKGCAKFVFISPERSAIEARNWDIGLQRDDGVEVALSAVEEIKDTYNADCSGRGCMNVKVYYQCTAEPWGAGVVTAYYRFKHNTDLRGLMRYKIKEPR